MFCDNTENGEWHTQKNKQHVFFSASSVNSGEKGDRKERERNVDEFRTHFSWRCVSIGNENAKINIREKRQI